MSLTSTLGRSGSVREIAVEHIDAVAARPRECRGLSCPCRSSAADIPSGRTGCPRRRRRCLRRMYHGISPRCFVPMTEVTRFMAVPQRKRPGSVQTAVCGNRRSSCRLMASSMAARSTCSPSADGIGSRRRYRDRSGACRRLRPQGKGDERAAALLRTLRWTGTGCRRGSRCPWRGSDCSALRRPEASSGAVRRQC